jgi:hypothetical protein
MSKITIVGIKAEHKDIVIDFLAKLTQVQGFITIPEDAYVSPYTLAEALQSSFLLICHRGSELPLSTRTVVMLIYEKLEEND